MKEIVSKCRNHGGRTIDEVYKTKQGFSCKLCLKEYQIKNREKINKLQRLQNSQIRQKLGGIKFNKEDYFLLLKKQNGKCAICNCKQNTFCKDGTRRRLSVDHDHQLKIVRGLLCNNCNHGLGKFKDSVKNLTSALKYLKKVRHC